MGKKELLISSSGIIAVVLTRKILEFVGVDNIDLQTKIFLYTTILVIYAIKSIREKDKDVRKYSIISSIIFFIFGIFLFIGMVLKEGFPQVDNVVRKPLGVVLFILFASNLVPLYAAYNARKQQC
jgi:hypothetical protein